MWIIIHGNPSEGFKYIGPFTTHDNAMDWAIRSQPAADWWVAVLEHSGDAMDHQVAD